MQITSGLPEGFNAGAYDMIVVGAGYAGAVCARRLAETIGYRVAVLERRSHIAGNAFDCTDEAGILVHEYGPHIYHTFNERVHNFLSRFTKWTDYQHKVLANINGTLMPVPFNHASLKLAFGDERGELYQSSWRPLARTSRCPLWSCARRTTRILPRSPIMSMRTSFFALHHEAVGPDAPTRSTLDHRPRSVVVGDDDRYFPASSLPGHAAGGLHGAL